MNKSADLRLGTADIRIAILIKRQKSANVWIIPVHECAWARWCDAEQAWGGLSLGGGSKGILHNHKGLKWSKMTRLSNAAQPAQLYVQGCWDWVSMWRGSTWWQRHFASISSKKRNWNHIYFQDHKSISRQFWQHSWISLVVWCVHCKTIKLTCNYTQCTLVQSHN